MSTTSRSSTSCRSADASLQRNLAEFRLAKRRALKDLRGYLKLEPNWDSYGARSIDPNIVEVAEQFLAAQLTTDTPLPNVVPTAKGGIQLEWDRDNIYMEMEFVTPLRLGFFWETTAPHASEDSEVSVDSPRIDDLLAQLSHG